MPAASPAPRARSKRRVAAWLAAACVVGLVALNGHARAMTTWIEHGDASGPFDTMTTTARIEALLFGVRVRKPANAGAPDDLGLAFQTLTIPGDPRLEAWFVPHAKPAGLVLMFHGYAASKSTLLPAAKGFHDLGWAVLMVDFRGSGGSDGQGTSIGVHEADDVMRAADLAAALDVPGPRVFYGFSMGAVAILRAASLDLIAPDAAILGAPFDRLRSTVANRFAAMGLPAFPAADAMVFWGAVQQGFAGASHDPVVYAESAGFPVLQLHGELDWRVTVNESRAVHAALAGPKRMHVFKGVGHAIYRAERPAQWQAVVEPFLASLLR